MRNPRRGPAGVPAPRTAVALVGYGLLASLVGGLVGGFAPWQSVPAQAVANPAPAAHAPAPAAALPPAAAERAGAAPAPRAPTAEAAAPGGAFEPVLHARKAGIATCMDSVAAQSRRVIDARHAALSVWNTREPDRGTFQSILALRYENALAPNGAAILTATPDGTSRCGGTFVQVYPTALSCAAIQAELVKSGKTVAALLDLPLVAAADGTRELLMPTAGGGCVIVATNLE